LTAAVAWEAPERIGTPEKRAALEAYARRGNVTAACLAANVGRTTWYTWRNTDPDFDSAVAEAEQAAADFLEDVAVQRATAGPSPSDTLLIFLLKGIRPEKYRERYSAEITGKDGGPLQHEDVTAARDRVRHRLSHLMGIN